MIRLRCQQRLDHSISPFLSRISVIAISWTVIQLFNSLMVSAVVQDIDNGLVGEPEVKCGVDVVDLQFRTSKPFKGKVFVKGHYADSDCKVDYTDAGGTDKPNGGIIIHHGACDMQRQRMISPQGMQFSTVIVISFHPVFITKTDKAYHIKCLYRELDRSVSNSLEVSQLTTALISHTMPMPQCSYTIRKDEIDGEVLKYARVGEQVVHRWQCDTDVYGILVHSCYVEDGQGEKVTVVDEHGCHTDRYILGDPTYVEKLNMAYRESHVFKFADKVTVRFQCQIRLCLKVDDGCKGITPPICASPIDSSLPVRINASNESNNSAPINYSNSSISSNRTRLRAYHRFVRDTHDSRSRTMLVSADDKNYADKDHHFHPVDGDFNSQYIYVLDSTENPDKGSSREQESWKRFLQRASVSGTIVSEVHENVCMSTITFGLLMAIVTIVFMSAALAAFVIIVQRAKRHNLRKTDRHTSVGEACGVNGVVEAIFGCHGTRSTTPASSTSIISEKLDGDRPPCYNHMVALWNHGENRK